MARNLDHFHSILRSLYEFQIDLSKTESIETWPTQLAGNRANRYPVLVTGKIDATVYTVKLPANFQLARVGAGYDLDIVNPDKSRVSNLWASYANRNEPHPDRETLAVIGYFVCQLTSGIPLSYESGGKVAGLKLVVDMAGFSSLTVKIKIADRETIEYDLSTVKALFTGLMPVYNRFASNYKADTVKAKHSRVDRSVSEQRAEDVFSDSPVKRQPAKRQPAKRQVDNPAKMEL